MRDETGTKKRERKKGKSKLGAERGQITTKSWAFVSWILLTRVSFLLSAARAVSLGFKTMGQQRDRARREGEEKEREREGEKKSGGRAGQRHR